MPVKVGFESDFAETYHRIRFVIFGEPRFISVLPLR